MSSYMWAKRQQQQGLIMSCFVAFVFGRRRQNYWHLLATVAKHNCGKKGQEEANKRFNVITECCRSFSASFSSCRAVRGFVWSNSEISAENRIDYFRYFRTIWPNDISNLVDVYAGFCWWLQERAVMKLFSKINSLVAGNKSFVFQITLVSNNNQRNSIRILNMVYPLH